ncbi:METTL21C [Symbiodinium natans]|uniref:METTL21C protein n=1 Tax=Symbiodinium natans TaxID=878477 RepID=A0A812HA40_9DINO|nr:METTL21C [Symbiodinium natans]
MGDRLIRTPEDEEFAEADEILSDLRKKADTGEGDLPWGDCLSRSWEDGVLRVTRSYATGSDASSPDVIIQEFPYSAHPCSGVGGTGGMVWPGAIVLASQLRARPELLSDATVVLELGAGCGLPGLAAASLLRRDGGARRVILTDGPEAVLTNLEHNARANEERVAPVALEVAKLIWEELLDGTTPPPAKAVDVLLGSDVIWGDRGPMVGRVARLLVRPGGWLIISAQKGREGLDTFQRLLCSSEEASLGPTFSVEVLEEEMNGEAFLVFICHRLPA